MSWLIEKTYTITTSIPEFVFAVPGVIIPSTSLLGWAIGHILVIIFLLGFLYIYLLASCTFSALPNPKHNANRDISLAI